MRQPTTVPTIPRMSTAEAVARVVLVAERTGAPIPSVIALQAYLTGETDETPVEFFRHLHAVAGRAVAA